MHLVHHSLAKRVRRAGTICLAVALAAQTGAPSLLAGTITKADNNANLNSPGSWLGGVPPGSADIALWNNTVTSPNITTLGADLTWFGIQITDPAGDVTINNDGHVLTLPTATGINMSAATASLTLNNNLNLSSTPAQAWNIATLLTVNGNITSSSVSSTRGITKSGSGILILGGINSYLIPMLPALPFVTTINAGSLKLAGSFALNYVAANFTINGTSSTLDLAGYNALIGNLNGTGAIVNSSATPAALTLVTTGNVSLPSFLGVITDGPGATSLLKYGPSTQILSGFNTYTGSTTIARGALNLLHTTNTLNNILSPSSSLVMAGGILTQQLSNTGTNVSQTFASTIISPGPSSITQTTNNVTDMVLDLGNVSRSTAGGTVNFAPVIPNSTTAGIFTTTSLTSSGIFGGWATTNSGNDWATRDTTSASSTIQALAPASYINQLAPGINSEINSHMIFTLNDATASIHFGNGARTLSLLGHNTIESGGILVTSSGSGSLIDNESPGAADLTSGNGADLIVITTSSVLTISAPIVNNGAAPIALTKSGNGTLALSAANTYSAGTYLNTGKIILNPGATPGPGPITITREASSQFPTQLIFPNGMILPNNIIFNNDDTSFGTSMVDVASSASATLTGNISAPATPNNQYRLGLSIGSLTLTGAHISGAPAPAPAPLFTVLWGNYRVNAFANPSPAHIIFAGTSSLTSYQTPISLSYVNVLLKDNATFTVLGIPSGTGLAMDMGPAFANFPGNSILTIQDNAFINLGALDFSLSPLQGLSTLNLNGGSIALGQFVKSSERVVINFNGTTLFAAKDSTSFLPAVSLLSGYLFTGGAKFNTNGHNISISLALQTAPTLNPLPDGGILKDGPGTLTLNGEANVYSGPTTILQGGLLFSGPASHLVTHSIGAVTGPGSLMVAAGLTSNGVTVNDWAISGVHTIRAGIGNAGTSKVNSLNTTNSGPGPLSGQGKLDITDNKLIVQSIDPADKTAKITDLNLAITSGFHNGDWKGNGITSSSAALDPAHYGIGVFDNALLNLAQFGGQTVDTSSILISIAHLGDANHNGIVDIQDLTIVANNWQKSRNNWAAGDLNRDGIVDIQDFTLVANNWQKTSTFALIPSSAPTSQESGPTNVPEPASLFLLSLSPLLLRNRRISTRHISTRMRKQGKARERNHAPSSPSLLILQNRTCRTNARSNNTRHISTRMRKQGKARERNHAPNPQPLLARAQTPKSAPSAIDRNSTPSPRPPLMIGNLIFVNDGARMWG